MAKKSTKKTLKPVRPQLGDGVEILNAGSVLEDPITRTLETNYMPYAMSVIVSRALPEIDGFKPAHRKLLYTMYEMGLLKGARTKSANIVGSTMHLNPHGDAAIYDTMVRMGRGNESLLVPFVDSKGNFGKAYSRDMSCAAARYTEAKLEGVCEELFRDIDKETVDFVPNYDSTTTEPTLLPVTFPTILANNTLGIAVGILAAFALKGTLFRGEAVPFVMELPNYRLPGLKNVMQLLWEKARDFLERAFTVIFMATIVIWFLQNFDLQLSLTADPQESILAFVASGIAPLFAPLGFADWRVSTALITGFMAKESVVSTLTILFGSSAALGAALSPAAAAPLLVFCLLYTPCIAAVASVKRELGGRWAAVMVLNQCVVAWAAAFIVRLLALALV